MTLNWLAGVVVFVFSKIFWIVVQPLSLGFLLVLAGIAASAVHRRRSAMAANLAGIFILFVSMFTTLGPYLMQGLEDRFARPVVDLAKTACAIVLGGGLDAPVDSVRGGYDLNDAGDRYVEAIRLARAYPSMQLIVSGGDGSLEGGKVSEAVIARRLFADFGIAPDRVLEDTSSRNTFENAVNTKDILVAHGLSHCLMITSAFHMPRSVAVFRHQGLNVIPWAVDYRTTGQVRLRFDVTDPLENAVDLSVAAREWAGIAGYYVAGRVSTLYPTP